MNDLFVNPWSMAAGAALVSTPIIIHLINRMRYKRIQWAAMEFLLKAQKRMKRKAILEQLLLLLMRILLVALLGLLAGRFLGFGSVVGKDTRTTVHIAILDDTPSMSDSWRADDGSNSSALEQAKKILAEQIAPAASQATSPQLLQVIRLSDLETPLEIGRLNTTTIEELKDKLKADKPGTVRVSPAAGLQKAREMLAAMGTKDVSQVVHFLSDFRATDWTADDEAIKKATDELTTAGVKVHLTDVLSPYRKLDDKRPPVAHDNVGIVEFKPLKLTVAKFQSLEFTLKVKNYGSSELTNARFSIKVNGDENAGGRSVVFPSLPPGQEKTERFEVQFNRGGSEEKPLERFSLVTAELVDPAEAGGIAVDNVRHAVVEVRERLPILVVDGRPSLRDKKEGDAFYLRPIFTTVYLGFNWEYATSQDLATRDLRNYSTVYLVNVPSVTEAAAANLTRYVQDGGGVGIFLGPDVNPKEYNQYLYADGKGILPVPLPDRPSEPLTEEQRFKKLFSFSKKVLLKDRAAKSHGALAGIYLDDRGKPIRDDDYEKFFNFVMINQYWPIQRIGKWRDDRSVQELYCLPNDRPMADFEGPARQISGRIPLDDPEFEKSKAALTYFRNEINRVVLTSDPLAVLAGVFDRFLGDARGDEATEAALREFWANPKTSELKADTARLRDAVKFGDPLYLAKTLGRGRVTAMMTTAGEQWNDWATGPGRPSYLPLIKEMENYLSGGGAEDNVLVGNPIDLKLDAARYKDVVRRTLMTLEPGKPGAVGVPVAGEVKWVDLKDQTMVAEGDKLALKFDKTATPGAYLFSFTTLRPSPTAGGQAVEEPEYRAFALNVDTITEGDLRRIQTDDIRQKAAKCEIHSPDDVAWLDTLTKKQSDLSESGWMFLALLLLLIAEQAMAVRLSYHTGPSEIEGTAPSAAGALRKMAHAPEVHGS